jgi:hypothetical protein
MKRPFTAAMDHFTALHFTNDTACAELLLKSDPGLINRTISKGNKTALHLAVSKGSTDLSLVTCLLKHGADVTARTYQGVTPLDLTKSKSEIHKLLASYDKNGSMRGGDKTTTKRKTRGGDEDDDDDVQSLRPVIGAEDATNSKKAKVQLSHLEE